MKNHVINQNKKAGFPVLFLTTSISCQKTTGKIAFVWCMAKKLRTHLPLVNPWMADYTENLAMSAFARVVRWPESFEAGRVCSTTFICV
jgi:hypothetical protein